MDIPSLGFGTYKLSKDDAYTMVTSALKKGYRLIDTAELYCNEAKVAQAIKESEIPRREIFLCTKASTKYHGNIEKSVRKRMRTFDYIDLLLLHWPSTDHLKGWEIMCQLQRDNPDKIKKIGICNISQGLLEELIQSHKKPDAIQIELNPYCHEKDLIKYCQKNEIPVIAHSCLGFGKALEYEEVVAMSEKHGHTPAKILLRWAKEHADTILTSCNEEVYLEENMKLDIPYVEVLTDREERMYYFR
jgi:diketogulonate reductase-like aldo/keto reductase